MPAYIALKVVNTYPLMMYQMGDPRLDNPIKGIFHRLALHNRVSFQAMLAIASKHFAGVGGQVDTVQSLTHKMRALRLINQELSNPDYDKSDGLLYSVASMAVIEVRILSYLYKVSTVRSHGNCSVLTLYNAEMVQRDSR